MYNEISSHIYYIFLYNKCLPQLFCPPRRVLARFFCCPTRRVTEKLTTVDEKQELFCKHLCKQVPSCNNCKAHLFRGYYQNFFGAVYAQDDIK